MLTTVYWNCGAAPKAVASLFEPLAPNPSPDINRLLRTNDVPLDSEIQVVQSIISDAEDHLHALDAQILPLQTALAQLVRRRDETVEYLRQHRAVISPIRRVPPELVCEILALSSAENRLPKATPPWQLGAISRPWRQYAISYPLLWSSVRVRLEEPEMSACLPALETQLLRCAEASLHIHWFGIESAPPDRRILDMMLPHSNRWRAVSFYPNTSESVVDWLEPVRDKLDKLEKLQV
ncbi:hypothetical protein C8R45DRAFT_1027484 [Mycena sanguinolenta]|nr:hypothetical protein C8R45DRAFT_1027484 [Mycena sanguinolenta]